ncbi:sulfatase-like hydrolase/transferase [Candidatus Binatia bacterium]|nr:sulfatase-like hydrolase/transferase [Candidatus Binatia bacterium]
MSGSRRLALSAVVLALVFVAAWALVPRHGKQAAATPRNLILISIDTLRADHLGVYGYERDTSPALDAFARRSVRFERAISQGESTLPGHGAMLTSRYYGSYGSTKIPVGPPPEVDTLAEILKGHGFATWGFVDGGFLRRAYGFDQGFEHYEDQRIKIKANLEKVEPWLDAHAATADRFFLFVHCYDVHTPYNAPDPYGSSFVDRDYRGTFRPNAANFDAVERQELAFGPEDLRYAIARYDGGIRHVDHWIGSFLERLERRGLLETSLVVITSDHGEEFLEHGGFQHKKIFHYPNLHVPLIIHAPGRDARTVEDPVELIDLVPTVLDLLGLPQHPGTMGRSLAKVVDGGPTDALAGHLAFAESSLPGNGWRSVVSRQHQLLYDVSTDERRLFDLEADPTEQHDVAGEHPEVVAQMMGVLQERLAENARRNSGAAAKPRPIDEETRRQLRALGYVHD